MQYEDTHIYFHIHINAKKLEKFYFNSCNRNLKEIYKIPLNYLFETIYFCSVLLLNVSIDLLLHLHF